MTGKKTYCTTTMLFALSVGMMTQLEVANAAADVSQTNISGVEITGDTTPEFTNLDEALRASNSAR